VVFHFHVKQFQLSQLFQINHSVIKDGDETALNGYIRTF